MHSSAQPVAEAVNNTLLLKLLSVLYINLRGCIPKYLGKPALRERLKKCLLLLNAIF